MLDTLWLLSLAFSMLGCTVGALAYRHWTARQEQRQHSLPERWPLDAVTLLSDEERKVWHWLKGAFQDQNVLVKTPISRFTCPREKKYVARAFEVLNSLYCTFVVATSDGTVIGCLDVPNEGGLARSHLDIKENILASCGIAYLVVHPGKLPSIQAVRAAFLEEVQIIETQEPPALRDAFAQELTAFSKSLKDKYAVSAAVQASPATTALRQRAWNGTCRLAGGNQRHV